MIDITVENNQVTVENRIYHSFNDKDELAQLVSDIIEKCLYSGESLILYKRNIQGKTLVQEWVNSHVSSRYNRRNEIGGVDVKR